MFEEKEKKTEKQSCPEEDKTEKQPCPEEDREPSPVTERRTIK